MHGVAAGEWYRLITSAFVVPATGLSGLGFMDILFNMWALVFVGPALEGLLGRVRFLAVYLLSAVGGAVMYYYLAPPNHPAAGASGAIYGLFGAWFVVSRRLRLDTRGIVVLIAINLALSFFFHSAIAWQDHIGGLLTGALLTAAYVYAPAQEPRRHPGRRHRGGGGPDGGRGRGQERSAHQRRALAAPGVGPGSAPPGGQGDARDDEARSRSRGSTRPGGAMPGIEPCDR